MIEWPSFFLVISSFSLKMMLFLYMRVSVFHNVLPIRHFLPLIYQKVLMMFHVFYNLKIARWFFEKFSLMLTLTHTKLYQCHKSNIHLLSLSDKCTKSKLNL